MAALTHLDTHVVVWIAAGRHDRLSPSAVTAIESDDLGVSPLVRLELQYLVEAGRIDLDPGAALGELARSLGLREFSDGFGTVVDVALDLTWTRDPFDRLIAAHAVATEARLLTKDQTLLDHVPGAFWNQPAAD